MSEPARAARGFFGHPKGLQTLFFTEMWERFSYYGMRAFLALYIAAPTEVGGLGEGKVTAGIVYGLYTAMVYLMSLPGGWIADRFIGQRKAVMLGGVLIMFGHIVLAIPVDWSFYPGLGLIIVGTGFLKPNVSTMVGQLYSKTDQRRDAAYTIFYMGINIGALVAPLVCGYLAESDSGFRATLAGWGLDPNLSWHIGFGAAAVGMAFGLVQYYLGWHHLGDTGLHPTIPSDPVKAQRDRTILYLIGAGTVALIGAFIALTLADVDIDGEDVANIFLIALTLTTVALFYGMITQARDDGERRRIRAMIPIFLGCVAFFGIFEQAGSTLNFFASEKVDRVIGTFVIPSSWFQSVNSTFVLLLGPVAAMLWLRLNRANREPTPVSKFAIGMLLTAASLAVMLPAAMMVEDGKLVSPVFLIVLYLFATAAELCISPVGLSTMNKLAPDRLAGMVMGTWFLATAIGNYLAGRAEALLTHNLELSTTGLFAALSVFAALIAALLYLVAGPVKRMLAGSESASGKPPVARVVKDD
jgi:POT family proton-dependent oligopeptide transporter